MVRSYDIWSNAIDHGLLNINVQKLATVWNFGIKFKILKKFQNLQEIRKFAEKVSKSGLRRQNPF